ncbi:tail fiber assembly protein [Pseudomonas qingdaonensis]|uniref:tail fiber assembly protein n=2 Tax=Pseudomonas qingdaonensis TaxID=2056231 RepID=UPI0028A6CB19|nr:tail fiber assembly protein [Pseudomonas qingdaonensis]
MIIKLSPVRSDLGLVVARSADILEVNGVEFDFTRLPDGATLPAEAVDCEFVIAPVERISGGLVLTLMLPHGADASEQSRFPVDIVSPADGRVPLPTDRDPQPDAPASWPAGVGAIDWSEMVTAEMKQEAAAAQLLGAVQADAASRRAAADSAIAPLQDAVDIDDATDAEVLALKAWKKYRVALNRLPEQPGYPTDIDWPALPA